MDFLKLTFDVLSVDEILKLVSNEKCGAVSIFVGTTRDNFEGKEVWIFEYIKPVLVFDFYLFSGRKFGIRSVWFYGVESYEKHVRNY